MTKKRKRDGLSLPALFFSLFFCGVSGLYIYGVRDFSSLAFYILVSIAISLIATLGARRQSGNLRLYFENGIGRGGAPLFCGLLAAMTVVSLLCDAVSLCIRISSVYGGCGSAIFLIIVLICVWSAMRGAGAVSGGAQISVMIAAPLALLALFSRPSLYIYTYADAYGALNALGGMGAVFCLVSHTYCGGDPDITAAFGARSKVPENRALSVLAVSCGAFISAAVFHALVAHAAYSDGVKIFFIFAEWIFSFIRLGAYAFTVRDCAASQRSTAAKTVISAVIWLSSAVTLAALSRGGRACRLLFDIAAIVNVFFAVMLAADVLFITKKSRRGVAKRG